MNFRVAVVEDQTDDAAVIDQHFKRFSHDNAECTFTLDWFENGQQFLFQYHPIYDIVIMDISMPGMNGMDVAAALRKVDQSVLLIFITSLANYAVKGYEVDAFDFVLKPVSYPSFSLKMKRVMGRLQALRGQEIVIRLRDGFQRIPVSQIVYVEVRDHDLLFHTVGHEISSYGNLRQVEQSLDPRFFCRCSSSYLVNLSYVQSVRGNTVFTSLAELPLGRYKKKTFLAALNNYIGGNFL